MNERVTPLPQAPVLPQDLHDRRSSAWKTIYLWVEQTVNKRVTIRDDFSLQDRKELVNDVCAEIFKQIEKISTPGTLQGAIINATDRLLADHLKFVHAKKRDVRITDSYAPEATGQPTAGGTEQKVHDTFNEKFRDQAKRKDAVAIVREAIEKLKPKQQELYRLKYENDLPSVEIGRRLGKSREAVDKAIFDLRAKIKMMLQT